MFPDPFILSLTIPLTSCLTDTRCGTISDSSEAEENELLEAQHTLQQEEKALQTYKAETQKLQAEKHKVTEKI